MAGTSQEKRFARLGHRDADTTGLDPTLFRMFSATQGRWLTVDANESCQQDMPQILNRYAYVSNNPTNWPDANGRFILCGTICVLACLDFPPPFNIECGEYCLALCAKRYLDTGNPLP